jgi:opacity protein-like surface antigen
MFTTRSITLSFLAMQFAVSAGAQDSTSAQNPVSTFARRFSFTASVIHSRPQGELARNVGLGYGINGAAMFRLDASGVFSLRGDVGGLQYGNVSRTLTLGDIAGNQFDLRLRTSNYIVPMTVGAQVTLPTGMVRPYANAGVGAQAYFTETTLESGRAGSNIASTTDESDFVASMTVGGGAYIALPLRGHQLDLDIGVQYFDGSRARYLAPASVNETTGVLSTRPIESSAHLLVLKLGARFGW